MKKICCYLAMTILLASSAFQCSNEQEKDLMTCCGPPPCSANATLTGTWRLQAFQNVATNELDNDPDPKGRGVVFTFKDDQKSGAIEGHTFVNEISATYTLSPECSIEIKSFGGTKVGEPGWSGRAWLAAGEGSFHVTSENLVITLKNSTERLIFKKLK